MALSEWHEFDGCGAAAESGTVSVKALPMYLLLGVLFGYVLARSEVLSWFRIQEMFHFQSIRMFGIIGSAIATAALSLRLLRLRLARSLGGEPFLTVAPKTAGWRKYAFGGTLFGLGWAMTGACPGPLFALVGGGNGVFIIAILSALLGTMAYGVLKPRLPH